MVRRPSRGTLAAPLLLQALLAAPAWAERWQVVPSLALEETYTDNLRLAPAGAEQADWITQVRPALAFSATGARLRLNGNYAVQALSRAGDGSDELIQSLNASANAELAPRLLYLDASALHTQQNISLLAPQAASNVNVTGNRTTVTNTVLSPYLRRDIGAEAQVEARLTHSSVRTGSSAPVNTDTETGRVDLRASSGPAYRLLTWSGAYHRDRTAREASPAISTESISGSARRLVTPALGVRLNAGYDRNDYGIAAPSPGGLFWSLGPEWTPTPRTRLVATAGRRYESSNFGLDASHRTRLTVWSATYSEDITTTQQQTRVPSTVDTAAHLDSLFATGIPDAAARQAAVQRFILLNNLPPTMEVPLNFLSSVPFRSKRLLASVGLQGTRHTVLLSVSHQTREALDVAQPGAGDFVAASRTEQTGGNVLWTWAITPLTSATLNASVMRNEFPALSRSDQLTIARAALNRQLLPRVSLTASYRRVHNASSTPGAQYDENAVSAAVVARF